MNIHDFIVANEIGIRLAFFLGIFAVMAGWEVLAPKRALAESKPLRWASNLGLVMLNSIILRLLFPAAAVGMAGFAAHQDWGLFSYYDLPFVITVVVSVIALDLAIYFQHVMFHAVPALWRLHRVHHVDMDFDVTTGARFHPIEIVLSMLIKFAAILVLGPPLIAVVIFEVLLNATSMFNHGNVRMPAPVDRVLRWFLVTPDMHRVHHSVEDDETNSNFGFSLPWWDRLFGTYRGQPRRGHQDMEIGIHHLRDARWCSKLPGMLVLPFVKGVTGYAINRRTWGSSHERT